MESSIILNLPSLLEFFDEKVPSSKGHATSINAVLGEEIAIGIMVHYFASRAKTIKVKTPCVQGTQKGARLDCWILTDNVLYQVEIKNWSSHSVGGRVFPREEFAIKPHLINRWENQWIEDKGIPRDKAARKVLIPMRPPVEWRQEAQQKALLCFWDPMHPEGLTVPFFSVPTTKDCTFPELHVFSLSNHVRNLIDRGIHELPLSMPDTVSRLAWLKRICGK